MKFRVFFLFAAVLLISCTTKVAEETIESYPDGSPKVVRFYKDDGRSKTLVKECMYYPNHKKYMEGTYKNGKRDGKWTSWFDNGNKWSEGYFKNGIDHGKRTVYHENGQKLYEGDYTDGIKTGKWLFYDDKGKFTKGENYGK